MRNLVIDSVNQFAEVFFRSTPPFDPLKPLARLLISGDIRMTVFHQGFIQLAQHNPPTPRILLRNLPFNLNASGASSERQHAIQRNANQASRLEVDVCKALATHKRTSPNNPKALRQGHRSQPLAMRKGTSTDFLHPFRENDLLKIRATRKCGRTNLPNDRSDLDTDYGVLVFLVGQIIRHDLIVADKRTIFNLHSISSFSKNLANPGRTVNRVHQSSRVNSSQLHST